MVLGGLRRLSLAADQLDSSVSSATRRHEARMAALEWLAPDCLGRAWAIADQVLMMLLRRLD